LTHSHIGIKSSRKPLSAHQIDEKTPISQNPSHQSVKTQKTFDKSKILDKVNHHLAKHLPKRPHPDQNKQFSVWPQPT
jgi:hypothetical protein